MSIKVHANAPLSSAIISDTQRSAPVTNDTQWFNHLLTPPASPTQPSSSDSRFSQPLVQRSDYLQTLSNKAARALVQTSHNAGPIDIIKSTRAMSAFHLETVLTAKMISKTSQAIEKLTNLS